MYFFSSVLHPEKWLRKILSFLDLPWNDAVMHHEQQINKKGLFCLIPDVRFPDWINDAKDGPDDGYNLYFTNGLIWVGILK